jgi:hypothetical protein
VNSGEQATGEWVFDDDTESWERKNMLLKEEGKS